MKRIASPYLSRLPSANHRLEPKTFDCSDTNVSLRADIAYVHSERVHGWCGYRSISDSLIDSLYEDFGIHIVSFPRPSSPGVRRRRATGMQLFVSAVGSARFLECRCRLLSRLTGPTIPTVNVCHALVACSPFGLGVRMPVGDIADLPVILGVNAEVQFRPGSVVAATSPDFPVTYYGTVNPCANMAIMARIGVAFGR